MPNKRIEKPRVKLIRTDAEVDAYEKDLKKFEADYRKAYSAKVTKELTRPQQMLLAGFPSDLSRSTIFFPIPRRDRKKIQKTPSVFPFKTKWSWGEYEGRKLSVDDEDLLLACLYLHKKHKTSVFITTYPKLQKLLGIKLHPSNNKQIKESLERFLKASFTINFKGKEGQAEGIHILKYQIYNRKIKITFDEEFLSKFLQSYTLQSLSFRMKIRGDIAKLLFTFLTSHRDPATYSVKTLVEVLNLNKKHPEKVKRAQLKRAFNQLWKQGFLTHFNFDKERGVFTLEAIPKKERKKLT